MSILQMSEVKWKESREFSIQNQEFGYYIEKIWTIQILKDVSCVRDDTWVAMPRMEYIFLELQNSYILTTDYLFYEISKNINFFHILK